MRIEVIELSNRQKKNGDEIKQTYQKDMHIQKMKNALERGEEEIRGVALAVCQWKDEHLWYEGSIWIPDDKSLRTTLISQSHDSSLAGHGGTANLANWSADNITGPK